MEFVMQQGQYPQQGLEAVPWDDMQKAKDAMERGTLFRPRKGGIAMELADTRVPSEEEHEPADEEGHEGDNLLEPGGCTERGGGFHGRGKHYRINCPK
eukprot:5865795-Amphidinium_carterae.1